VQFIAPVFNRNDALFPAVENRLKNGVDYAMCTLSISQQQYHETLAQLMADLPGYVNTCLITSYCKRFDPYATER
jgi:hypothetical protein